MSYSAKNLKTEELALIGQQHQRNKSSVTGEGNLYIVPYITVKSKISVRFKNISALLIVNGLND